MTYNGGTVFNTNLTGMGFAFQGRGYFNSLSMNNWVSIPGGNNEKGISVISHNKGERPTITNQAQIMLIKTGSITPGLLTGFIGRFTAGTVENGQWSPKVPITFSGGTVTEHGCAVSGNSSFTVALGTASDHSFTAVGSVKNRQPFTIGLSCAAGTKVNITLSGTADSTQPGTLVNNAQPSNDLNFAAQLIRTDAVSAGAITTSATYTLNYQ